MFVSSTIFFALLSRLLGSVNWVANELRALLLSFSNPVALPEQVVVDLVGYDAVLLVVGVLRDKFPHPLGHGHQFTYLTSGEVV